MNPAANILPLPKPAASPAWVKTKFANLWRYTPNGKYYVKAKVRGRPVRRSLGTKSLEIAKVKLDLLLDKERARAQRQLTEDHDMGHYASAYLAKVAGTAAKPRALEYRTETWAQVTRTWPDVCGRSPRCISKKDCEDWAKRAKAHYSATRFNGALETLRGVIRMAIKDGACLSDPTEDIARASVTVESPVMPSAVQFKAILKHLDDHARRRPAALIVRLLAYTGLRINEARHLQAADIDLQKGWLLARVTKNGSPRRVPIIREAEPVLTEWVKLLNLGQRLKDPRRALRSAGKASGLELTPHDLRHLFTTRCVESGVDIRTVAAWLGHKDGGRLLLQRYAHLRDEHSKKMANKVRF